MKRLGHFYILYISIIAGIRAYQYSFKTDIVTYEHGRCTLYITCGLTAVGKYHYPACGIGRQH